ncbi:hypothetical protein MK338_06615, partial [Streptococcus vestibularis]|nr:hypothetical protein [Streptococcus vestibularis]
LIGGMGVLVFAL